MAKKKMPFIRLSIVFIILIVASVFYSWGYRKSGKESGMMMDASMGDMMGENHLKDITIRDLIAQEEQMEAVQTEENSSDHHDSGKLIKSVHNITTITIVALIPFIIAGTIFLIIVWFDKS
ncbi:MAG: hypothetical protein K0R34_2934 [Herbinix sp.]|jgi:hypothetical protein|nr:hypothetical protein [Herbinix sp.]